MIQSQETEVILDIPNGYDSSKGSWATTGNGLTTKSCTSGLSNGLKYTCFVDGGDANTVVTVATPKPHYAIKIYNEVLAW